MAYIICCSQGKPIVTDFVSLEDSQVSDEDHQLWLLGSLERSSEHPLARAIVSFVEKRLGDRLAVKPFGQPSKFQAVTGRGASGSVNGYSIAAGNRAFAKILGLSVPKEADELMTTIEQGGKTAMLFFINGEARVVLGVSDEIKQDAAASITYLRDRMGIDVWMVTGDNSRTAASVGSKLSLPTSRIIAEALPATKLEHVRSLQAQGKVVAMVGDGVNDSPALAQADVGLSLGTGAEIANEASDIVLVKGHVTDVCTAFDLSRAIFRRIRWNFMWSLVYNCLGIPVAAGVFYPILRTRLPPTVAAVAMALSSISVVMNSLALRFYKPPQISSTRRQPYQGALPRSEDENDLGVNLLESDFLAEAAEEGDDEAQESSEPLGLQEKEMETGSTSSDQVQGDEAV